MFWLSFLFFNLQTGDFFKDDLPKAELYILARVLHDWSDEKLNILLSKVAEACTPGKRLLFFFKAGGAVIPNLTKEFCAQRETEKKKSCQA